MTENESNIIYEKYIHELLEELTKVPKSKVPNCFKVFNRKFERLFGSDFYKYMKMD